MKAESRKELTKLGFISLGRRQSEQTKWEVRGNICPEKNINPWRGIRKGHSVVYTFVLQYLLFFKFSTTLFST